MRISQTDFHSKNITLIKIKECFMQEINIGINPNKPQYTAEVLKLRKEAQELGIDDKEIDMCGNNIVCLEDKIYRKKREIEQQNSYSYSGPGM